MSRKLIFILCFFISFPFLIKAQDFELSLIPGRVEGIGRYFEIKDSEYLNIVLESREEINVILESIPRLISLNIEKSSISISTQLTLSGLKPNKTYYKYQDSYKNEAVFISDENGNFSWEQDLTQPHHVWFQEIKGTVFIPQDCTPPIGIWDASSSICTLTQNLNENVEIRMNNFTLDCNGHLIKGRNTGYGINLESKTNVVVKNCNLSDFSYGFYLWGSNDNILLNNTSILNNASGISLYFSNGNSLINNFVLDNQRGVCIEYSQGNILKNNIMSNNRYNFKLYGDKDFYFNNDIDTSNLVDGRPIYFFQDISDITLDNAVDAGTVYCIRCNNIVIRNLSLSNNYTGIFFYKTENSRIENVNISNNEKSGIWLLSSNNNFLKDNSISDNYFGIRLDSSNNNFIAKNITQKNYEGLSLYASSENAIEDNDSSQNSTLGIALYNSNNNLIQGNNISNNLFGGIFLERSSNNILKNNTSTLSLSAGIHLALNSNNNEITENNSLNNNYGIYLYWSDSNKVYHNNFINNTKTPQAAVYGIGNRFDDDYPSGGNYWLDYNGVDLKSGPQQDQEGSDGIGDTPYCFKGGCDRYPFMKENGWKEPKEPIPKEFWVEVKEDEECIYQEESLTTKLKCLPQGWILKVPNPEKKSWQEIPAVTQIEDTTDGLPGWTKKDFLNYDSTKQEAWKEKTKTIIFGKNFEVDPDFKFTKEKLGYGQTNKEIRYLQITLKHEGFFPVDVIATGYFGPITKEGIKKFQEKYDNLDGANGEVGDETIKKLNDILNENSILDKSRASTIKDRAEILFENPPDWLGNDFFQGASREEKLGLLLAMALQESGGLPFFDNEYVKPDPKDCGRGIMQITDKIFIGKGSKIECYKEGCKNCSNQEERNECKNYYTNTVQGIEANLEDGIYGIAYKFKESHCQYYSQKCELEENKGKEFSDYYGDGAIRFTFECGIPESEIVKWCTKVKKCNSKIKEVAKIHKEKEVVDVVIPCDHFKIIDSIWRYNGRTVSNQGCQGNDYLRCIANKLDDTDNPDEIIDTFGLSMPNKDNWIAKFNFMSKTANTMLKIKSPAILQVYDSQGRVTGLTNGEIYTGIPFSSYDEEEHYITLPFSYDYYYSEIIGINTGNYTYEATFTENDNILTFIAENIPISTSTIHRYQIDWQKLAQGEKGVILQIDAEGDGIFEKTIIADNELTYDEFILQTETIIDFDPNTSNFKSKGNIVTVYLELPEGFDVNQIDVSSILLNDSITALSKPTTIGDYDNDEIPDLMVKFERNKVQEILDVGEQISITVTGKVFYNGNYLDFKGDDKIKVIK